MKKVNILLLFLTFFINGFSQTIPANFDNKIMISNELVEDKLNKLPVSFRKNMGQWDDKIMYQGFSPGWNANINFLKNGVSFALTREEDEDNDHMEGNENERAGTKTTKSDHAGRFKNDVESVEALVWNIYFKGISPGATITSEGEQESHSNYMTGNDPSKYQINVPDYRVLNYNNVYDNIDLRYYSTGKNIKYDFILKPGADISNIQMDCKGIKNIRLNDKKQLEIINAWGTLIEEMPESYQVINGTKNRVLVEYVTLTKNTFGFKISGSYDKSQPLIIDPIILAWGTFVGASGTTSADRGYCYSVAVDPAGNVYSTGFYGGTFPVTPGAYNSTSLNNQNVFVFKLTPDATALIYATFLKSSSNDWGYGVVANAAGEAFVTGRAGAPNFPTTAGAAQTVHGGSYDVFVTKLNSTGTALIYSTFIGGSGSDEGYDIAINAAGEAFVTGYASKAGFPFTPGVFQSTLAAGLWCISSKGKCFRQRPCVCRYSWRQS